jgi:hypothetical protein
MSVGISRPDERMELSAPTEVWLMVTPAVLVILRPARFLQRPLSDNALPNSSHRRTVARNFISRRAIGQKYKFSLLLISRDVS